VATSVITRKQLAHCRGSWQESFSSAASGFEQTADYENAFTKSHTVDTDGKGKLARFVKRFLLCF